MSDLSNDELFKRGIALFNDEYFFEAHEEWEILWKRESGADKIFLQGLIQAAGHFVHLEKNNRSGAERLRESAKTKLAVQPDHARYRALDLQPLLKAMDHNIEKTMPANYLKPKL